MSMAVEPTDARSLATARACEECGYDLRGLDAHRPCPECGHLSSGQRTRLTDATSWTLSIGAGLVLLMTATLDAVASVLIQPFYGVAGGTLAALNLPGPKLWAMPLLQRPIGHSPALPGVTGTRVAILALLAIWLITAPRPEERLNGVRLLRLATRWSAVLLFGMAMGVLLANQGLWPSQLLPYRLALATVVELPASVLLYRYLRTLAAELPGEERRRTFDHLCWAVPAVIAGGSALLAIAWVTEDRINNWNQSPISLPLAALYGAVAVTCGVTATAAVGSLTLSFLMRGLSHLAPILPRTWSRTRQLWRGIAATATAHPQRLRRAGVATGLGLLIMLMFVGNDASSWLLTRVGVGGNLPFVNYVGPKFWVAPALPSQSSGWGMLQSRSVFMAFTVAAFWLVTIRTDDDGKDRDAFLRGLLRWMPILLLGLAFGADRGVPTSLYSGGSDRSEYFAVTVATCELPVTFLLYQLLARRSREVGDPRLARQFIVLAYVIVALVGTAMLMFLLSRPFLALRSSALVIVVCSLYGAATFATASIAFIAIVKLARRMLGGNHLLPNATLPCKYGKC